MKLRTQVFSFLGLSSLLASGGIDTAVAQDNTHYGAGALSMNTTGVGNEAFGGDAMYWNTTGIHNVADGYLALAYNTSGRFNVAIGSYALLLNTTGSYNSANGYESLYFNTAGNYNNAAGMVSLHMNTTGTYNNAVGDYSLYYNTTGLSNSASGYGALYRNTTGSYNSAEGMFALGFNTTGGYNIAIGQYAGYNLTTGSNNIDIGSRGAAAETGVIHIGTQGTQHTTYLAGVSGVNVTGGAAVMVNSAGQLGVVSSSIRYKEDVRSMGDVSNRLLALRPVTFRYKKADENGQKPEQYGLIAEEVAQVMPELVVYNQKGQPETVAYQTLAPLLLNELQREHKRADQQASELREARKQLASVQSELIELRRITTQLAVTRAQAAGEAHTDIALNLSP